MTKKTDEMSKKKVLWPQWIAGFGALMLITELGLMGGWSSPYVSQLTSPDSPFPVTLSEISWAVSLLNLGRFFGAIVGAVGINYFGSKTTILITCVPVTLCWLLTVMANSIEWLYAARLFGGASVGMTYSSYSFYLGEIADPSIRGILVALSTSGIPTGNLIMSTMGAYLSMYTSSAIALASCFVLITLFVWLPESSHHLIKQKLDEKAKSSIRWYHRDCDVETEFMELQKFIQDCSNQSLSDTLKETKTFYFRKSVFISSILMWYGQMCGINSILFYMESILRSAKVSVMEPSQVVIAVMAFGIVGSCLSILLMDRFGRKVLMITSCIGTALAFVLVTLEFQLLYFGFDPKTVQGLTIIGMVIFYVTVFMGTVVVPPTILGEIFPPHLKCIATFLVSTVGAVVAFISTATYLPLLNFMGERYLFLFYAFVMATGVPFTIFCVPETKGMSLQEIQDQLTGKK